MRPHAQLLQHRAVRVLRRGVRLRPRARRRGAHWQRQDRCRAAPCGPMRPHAHPCPARMGLPRPMRLPNTAMHRTEFKLNPHAARARRHHGAGAGAAVEQARRRRRAARRAGGALQGGLPRADPVRCLSHTLCALVTPGHKNAGPKHAGNHSSAWGGKRDSAVGVHATPTHILALHAPPAARPRRAGRLCRSVSTTGRSALGPSACAWWSCRVIQTLSCQTWRALTSSAPHRRSLVRLQALAFNARSHA